jgi:hypothetical protein
VWERGESEHAIDRALSILVAFSGRSRAELAALGIHQRDALLIRSRMLAFGALLTGVVVCPACGSELELELTLNDPPELAAGGAIAVDGRSIAFRAPNSYDLAAVATCDDAAAGEVLLRERCITADAPLRADALLAAENALAALCDPVAIDVNATCPACATPFAPPIDIAAVLWHEIATYARRVFDEVHVLASRYGWTESDVLALSDLRRRRYVETFA